MLLFYGQIKHSNNGNDSRINSAQTIFCVGQQGSGARHPFKMTVSGDTTFQYTDAMPLWYKN